jgi:hypothetical protein
MYFFAALGSLAAPTLATTFAIFLIFHAVVYCYRVDSLSFPDLLSSAQCSLRSRDAAKAYHSSTACLDPYPNISAKHIVKRT